MGHQEGFHHIPAALIATTLERCNETISEKYGDDAEIAVLGSNDSKQKDSHTSRRLNIVLESMQLGLEFGDTMRLSACSTVPLPASVMDLILGKVKKALENELFCLYDLEKTPDELEKLLEGI